MLHQGIRAAVLLFGQWRMGAYCGDVKDTLMHCVIDKESGPTIYAFTDKLAITTQCAPHMA